MEGSRLRLLTESRQHVGEMQFICCICCSFSRGCSSVSRYAKASSFYNSARTSVPVWPSCDGTFTCVGGESEKMGGSSRRIWRARRAARGDGRRRSEHSSTRLEVTAGVLARRVRDMQGGTLFDGVSGAGVGFVCCPTTHSPNRIVFESAICLLSDCDDVLVAVRGTRRASGCRGPERNSQC